MSLTTIADDAVGARRVITTRFAADTYSTMITSLGRLEPPVIAWHASEADALTSHADAVAALVTDEEGAAE